MPRKWRESWTSDVPSHWTPICGVPGDTLNSKGWALCVWPRSSSGLGQGFWDLLRRVLCCLWDAQASGREGVTKRFRWQLWQAWPVDGSELPQHLLSLAFYSQDQQGKGQKEKEEINSGHSSCCLEYWTSQQKPGSWESVMLGHQPQREVVLIAHRITRSLTLLPPFLSSFHTFQVNAACLGWWYFPYQKSSHKNV